MAFIGHRRVILTDCPITRRKRFHAVLDTNGDPVFQSRILWDCFEYLDAEGVEEYDLVSAEASNDPLVRYVTARKGT